MEASGGGQIMQKHRPSQSLGDGCGLVPTCLLVSGLYRIKWIRILSRGQYPSLLLFPSSSFHELESFSHRSPGQSSWSDSRMFTAASNLSSQPSTVRWALRGKLARVSHGCSQWRKVGHADFSASGLSSHGSSGPLPGPILRTAVLCILPFSGP